MKTQFTGLRECLVINQFMKHLIGGYKDQWPPVGKSSDTPKEVKNARREELPTGNREARGYGAGCVCIHKLTRLHVEALRDRSDLFTDSDDSMIAFYKNYIFIQG